MVLFENADEWNFLDTNATLICQISQIIFCDFVD